VQWVDLFNACSRVVSGASATAMQRVSFSRRPRKATVSQFPACRCHHPKFIERQLERGFAMATFNRIFSTQRLLQIIVVLGATVIMKLLA